MTREQTPRPLNNHLTDDEPTLLHTLRDENLALKQEVAALKKHNQFVDSIIESLPVAVFAKNAQDEFRINLWNRAAEHMFGIRKADILGKRTHDLWPKEQADAYHHADLQVCQQQVNIDIPQETSHTHHKGSILLHTYKVPLINPNTQETEYLLGISEDISEQTLIKQKHEIRNHILSLITTNASLQETLETLIQHIETSTHCICSILLLDTEGKHFVEHYAISLPVHYTQALHHAEISSKAGSCGTAAYHKKRVIVTDIATDPLWADYKELAASANLAACWSEPIFNSSGYILGTFAMYRQTPYTPTEQDISTIVMSAQLAGLAIEQQQTRSQINENEERYRLLFIHSNDALMTSEADNLNSFTSVNQAALKLFGATSEADFLKLNPILVSPEYQPDGCLSHEKALHVVQQAITHGSHSFEWLHTKIDGTPFLCSITLTSLKLQGKTIVQGCIRDISEYKRTEQALQEQIHQLTITQHHLQLSEERFKALWETASDAVLILDEASVIKYANPALGKIFGYSIHDAIGQTIGLLQPDSLKEAHLQGMHRYLQTKQRRLNWHRVESLGQHQNGTIFPIEISFSHAMINDESLFAGFIRDISERKEAEKLLAEKRAELQRSNEQLQQLTTDLEAKVKQRTAQLEAALMQANSATQAKSEFLATMSHEIRTPVNGIIGMAQLLEMENLTQEQRNFLETIRASGDSLLMLINDILDLSKIEAGKLELEPHSFDLHAEINSIVALYKPLALRKSLQLNSAIQGESIKFIIADKLRLRQILSNLIANAIKFTFDGHIHITTKINQHTTDNPCLCVMVSDTGIGISPERQDRLFKVFSQVDSSITRQYGGSGLGLAICARLVEIMGGKIGVQSQLNHGSCFFFEIPIKIGEDFTETSLKALSLPSADSQHHVLIVDDNVTNQIIMRRFLAKLDLKAAIANNGLEAIDYVKHNPVDLIFMDIQMPEMDGITATQHIRAMNLQKQPFILALTANAFTSDKERCLQAGMNDFLTKPFLFEHIKDKTLRYLAL